MTRIQLLLLLLLLLLLYIFRNNLFNFEMFANNVTKEPDNIMEEEDDIDDSHDVIEESKRFRIVDVSMNGCPFNHHEKESPCKTDICIKNPKSKECKEYIDIFCNKKDLDKINKIGCNIYYQVSSGISIRPRHEPHCMPDSPPHVIAQFIPQFIERDMID